MKKIGILFSFLILVLLYSSCTSTVYLSKQSDYYNQYVGQSERSIIRAWGAPTRETSDGDTGKILVYEQLSSTTSSSSGTMASSSALTGPIITSDATSSITTSTAFAQFFMDKDGICYDVKTNHVKEGKELSKGKTIGLIAGSLAGIISLATVAQQ